MEGRQEDSSFDQETRNRANPRSTAALFQGNWSQLLNCCCEWNISPSKATITQIAEFLYLQRKVKLSVPVVTGCHAVLSHVFSLAGIALAAILIIIKTFSSFKKTCPPREVKPPEQNLSLVLRSLIVFLMYP